MTAALASCNYFAKEKKGDAIAKAYDKYLYRSDLQGVVPRGVKSIDSIEIVRQFIDNWIQRQVILHQAENNLSPEQKDFTDRLETYRNSLIVYEYESELIRQKLDTLVDQEEIRQFYEQNPDNFQLRENIVRYSYVKIPKASAGLAPAKKAAQLLKSDRPQDLEKLDELCQSSMLSLSIDGGNWIPFTELQREIPIQADDQEGFLRNRTFVETSDSLYVYLVKFNDYKTKESLSPLSYETENIRNIIINRRKLELINRMEKEVFQKALENKEFEIF
ncbi:MAG: hypothetical protein FD166_63 [Bacteroidetes bacterium]|nr:MAG: hypothetical protein FD166_63 [Bacteroidota bacterium]